MNRAPFSPREMTIFQTIETKIRQSTETTFVLEKRTS
jgi:hypothetical protein